MSSRTIAQLRNDQADLAEALSTTRGDEGIATATIAESGATPACWLGRVDEVVAEDEQFGAHLKVARQKLAGTPPTPTDYAESAVVAYPLPAQSVSAYEANDYVLLRRVDGVLFATSGA